MTPVERIQGLPLLAAKGFSQREGVEYLGLCRSRLSYKPRSNPEREALRALIRKLALRHPTYGYRRIWAVLRKQGVLVSQSRVFRLWQAEKLALKPRKRKRRRRGEGCMPPPIATHPNHVWSCDFVKGRLCNGQGVRILTLVDEFTRESLDLHMAKSIPAAKVRAFLERVIAERGVTPEFIRSDNGPEFIEQGLNVWLCEQGTRPTFITPGSPWENGKNESFNGKFRLEFLDRQPPLTLQGLRIQAEWWRKYYNEERPHSALDYLSPAEFARRWYAEQGTEAPRAPNMGEPRDRLPTRRSRRSLASDPRPETLPILQNVLV